MLMLNRQDNEPEFDELSLILSDLEDFLNENIIFHDDGNENFDILINFQDS